jgi:peroxiredoxin
MKKIFYILLVILSQVIGYRYGYAQTKYDQHSFHLDGTIKADTGTVLLLPIGGKDFDPNAKNNYKAKIRQGTFRFDGRMAYPGAFLIAFFPTYVSSPFIIEAGSQTIACQIDSIREIPRITNRSMRELEAAPVNFYSSLTVSASRKALLLAYAQQHPDSYVALWETVRQLENGYVPILDSIYSAFSTSLKNNYTGKVIAQRLASSRTTAIGQVFPGLNLLDIHRKPISIPSQQKSKYLLIDFWFAHCSACIEEFPKLKELYDAYKDKGFSIAGISIDKQADIEVWKRTIKSRELNWSQYLDIAGKLTVKQLSINYFPSNFLLDGHGVIIQKNISPAELSKFLAEKL